MISSKDVVTMKIPYPDIHSGLAMVKHMYICKIHENHFFEMIKCQTYKPNIVKKYVKHYWIEERNPERNPFVKQQTLIDCDKTFCLQNIIIDNSLKTTIRSNVCDVLFSEIIKKLTEHNYIKEYVDEDITISINKKGVNKFG